MVKLRRFPDNWVHLSEQEQQEYIEYLLQHYMNYKVWMLDDNHIRIGDDVDIRQFNFNIDGKIISTYVVNQATFSDKDPKTAMLKKLFESYKDPLNPAKIEADKFVKNLKVFTYAFCISVPIMLCVGIGLEVATDKKEQKIEEQVKQYEKTLPQYNEYLKTQQQIQNYRDSLKNVKTK